jgi:Tol biopolymer transport system component
MLELSTGKIDKMEETNGRYSDSYHSWSSNSQWIAFASKRDDRVYGRPYFAHVSQDGSVSKAFLLPQENPETYLNTFKSYNIPELYNTAETYDAHELQKAYFGKEAENLRYKSIKK